MSAKISDGLLQVKEGVLYWTYAIPSIKDEEARPVLLFIHAGVADHTLWNEQVEHLVRRGWSCLAFDILGFGKSHASEGYLRSYPREPFNPLEHLDLLREEVLEPDTNVIPIGLSIGGSLALGYTVNRKEIVSGAVVISGGVRGFEHDNTRTEDRLFELAASLVSHGDVQGAANLQVRIWGDGPLQEPGRMAEPEAERMLIWNIEISARECAKTGGFALDTVEPEKSAGALLHTIDIPVAVAYGTYDETYTMAAMKYVGTHVPGATVREFKTAHMVNMELPEEFNQWLGDWLQTNFVD